MEINEEVSAQLKLLKLKPDGSDLTHLSADSLASLNSTWEAFLIAKFLPQPSKSHAALVSAVRRAFGIQSKHDFDLLRYNSERFILKFRHMVDRQREFHRQPSVVYESLLVFNNWDGEQKVEDVVLDRFNCWVQVHVKKQGNLLTEEVAKEFLKEVGYLVDIPGKKSFFSEFGKARAYLDISSMKPLVSLAARRYDAKRVCIIGTIKFEKIKVVCFVCGCLGHVLDDCPRKLHPGNRWKNRNSLTETNSLWGEWIFAPDWSSEYNTSSSPVQANEKAIAISLSDVSCTTDPLGKNVGCSNVEKVFDNDQRNEGNARIEYRAGAIAEFFSNDKEQIKGKIMNLTSSTHDKFRSGRIDVAAFNHPVLPHPVQRNVGLLHTKGDLKVGGRAGGGLVAPIDDVIVPAKVGDMSEDDMVDKFSAGVGMVTSLSLALSYPTLAAAPHSFLNNYKNVLAVAVATLYPYPQAKDVKENGKGKDPTTFATAAPSKEGKKKEKPAEQSEDDYGFCMVRV